MDLFWDQLLAVGAVVAFSFVVTFAIMIGLKKFLPGGVRVDQEQEEEGLDLTQHSETGYALERA